MERAEGCADEFAMLDRAFDKLVMPHVDESMQREAFDRVRFSWSPSIPSARAPDAPPLGQAERHVP
jgi:hypothetical protein